MSWWDMAAWVGVAVFAALILAGVVFVGLASWDFITRYVPKPHWGSPRNRGEVGFYDMRYQPFDKGKLIQKLRIGRMFGLSSAATTRWWFFGLMTFKEDSDGL